MERFIGFLEIVGERLMRAGGFDEWRHCTVHVLSYIGNA
jgi:hypothetical protein